MTRTTTSDLPVLELDRAGWRAWLSENHSTSSGCWLVVDRTKDPTDALPYLDAVEEALCFGWIDSTIRCSDGRHLQRFSRRRPDSNWTELNLERCRRLERLGLMTDAGRDVIPDREFAIDEEILEALRADPEAWVYPSRLDRFVDDTRKGIMRGNWNDDGRLLESSDNKSNND